MSGSDLSNPFLAVTETGPKTEVSEAEQSTWAEIPKVRRRFGKEDEGNKGANDPCRPQPFDFDGLVLDVRKLVPRELTSNTAFNADLFQDLTFYSNHSSWTSKRLHAHRNIMAARCPHIRTKLLELSQEKATQENHIPLKGKEKVYSLNDSGETDAEMWEFDVGNVEYDMFASIVKFCYTGDLDRRRPLADKECTADSPECVSMSVQCEGDADSAKRVIESSNTSEDKERTWNKDDWIALLRQASVYKMKRLQALVEEEIVNFHVDGQAVFELLLLAHDLPAPRLKNGCMAFIINNWATTVQEREKFETLPKELLAELLLVSCKGNNVEAGKTTAQVTAPAGNTAATMGTKQQSAFFWSFGPPKPSVHGSTLSTPSSSSFSFGPATTTPASAAATFSLSSATTASATSTPSSSFSFGPSTTPAPQWSQTFSFTPATTTPSTFHTGPATTPTPFTSSALSFATLPTTTPSTTVATSSPSSSASFSSSSFRWPATTTPTPAPPVSFTSAAGTTSSLVSFNTLTQANLSGSSASAQSTPSTSTEPCTFG